MDDEFDSIDGDDDFFDGDDEDEFDYGEFIENEFGESRATKTPLIWKVTAGVLLAIFLMSWLIML
ncbi:MAG: hypothetical protein AAF664_02745 [Planctomycetota bacterium]